MMEPNNDSQKISGIKCDVKNCHYHVTDNSCSAGSINVGPEHACDCSETVCATFQPNK